MKFQYFKADSFTSIEDAKKQYRSLVMRWHPDRPNGDLRAMQIINAEWDYLKSHNYNIHTSQSGNVYTDWNQDTPDEVTERFAEIIEQLIKMHGIEIEICGSFIWCSGDTKKYRIELKGMGFRWAPKKKMWFLAPKSWKKKGRSEMTIEDIRATYGSQKVTGNARKAYALTA